MRLAGIPAIFRWPACKIHRRTSHRSRCFWFGFGFIYRTSKSFRENRRLFCFAYEESKCMGLEEAVVNQATVWPESGADRTASSRENPVPSTAPNQYNPNPIFQIGNGFGFFLIFQSQRYNTLDLASKVSMQGAEIPWDPCEIIIQQNNCTLHIRIFFHWGIWYTWLNKSELLNCYFLNRYWLLRNVIV